MDTFFNAIFAILFILILIKPQKFGFFLGKDARLKAFFMVLIIYVAINQLFGQKAFNIHSYFNLIGFLWLILALKDPNHYAKFFGENLRRLKIVGIWLCVMLFLGICFPSEKKSDVLDEPKASTKVVEVNQDTKTNKTEDKQQKVKEVKKSQKIVHDYFRLSEKYIQEIYRATYQSQGMGVPEVDCRFMTYRDWEIVDGKMKVSEGTFYLGGNKNIEHTYNIRWRNKTGQPLCIVINEQQVFFDKETQMAAYDD